MRQQRIPVILLKNIIVVTGLLWMFCLAGIAYAIDPTLIPASIDRDELGDRVPLVLIHGLQTGNLSSTYWDIWDNFLDYYDNQSNGDTDSLKSLVKPYIFTYETLKDFIGDNPTTLNGLGRVFRDELQKRYDTGEFQGKPIIIVAHSMGGLVARSMMQERRFTDGDRGGDKIARLITLATPHHGTPASNIGYIYHTNLVSDEHRDFLFELAWDSYDGREFFFCGKVLQQLNNYRDGISFPVSSCSDWVDRDGFYSKIVAYGSSVIPSNSDYATGIIRSLPYDHLNLAGYTQNDGLVPLSSALFEGASINARRTTVACDHSGMPRGTLMRNEDGTTGEDCNVDGEYIFDKISADIIAAIHSTIKPIITSVTPNTLPGIPLPQRQQLSIYGTGFDSNSTLLFNDGTTDYISNPTYLRLIDSNTIEYDIAVGVEPANWTVKVVNDTLVSNVYPFYVLNTPDTTAPAAPIGLSAIPSSWSNNTLFYADWVNPSDPSGITKVWWKVGDGLAFNLPLPLFKPLPFSILPEGTETIYVWLEDGAGNKNYNNSSSVDVYLDVTAPQIAITSPTSNATYQSITNSIVLGGYSSDNLSGIKTITWSNDQGGSGAILAGGAWNTQAINLTEGENLITVVTVDEAGNVGADSITVLFTPSTSTYTLNISATNGTVSKNPDQASYAAGSQVTLTATPDTGYQFSGWSGACTGIGACNVTMTSNLSVIANFTETIDPPPAPTGTSATDGTYTDRVRVTWGAVSVATGYEVWRSLEANPATATRIAQTALLSYDDMSAPAETQFWYYVRAYSSDFSIGEFGFPDRGYRASPPPNDAWVVYAIDNGNNRADGTGFFAEIKVDSNNHAHIGYLMWDGKVWHATNATGAWKREIVGTSGNISNLSPMSLAIDSSNNMHISYRDNIAKDLVYATNALGGWQNTSIDSLGEVGAYSSIAVDTAGFIHISYQDETNHNLKYATNKTGNWVAITVDNNGWVGYGTSIALDSEDGVHISYATSADEMQLRYATNTAGSWNISVVDGNVNGGSSNALTSIGVDSGNKAHIVYRNQEGNLRYGTNASGAWQATTIDGSGVVKRKTSMAVDGNDHLHITYIVGSKLAYATNSSGSWSTFNLVGGIDNIDPTVNTDSEGGVHICFTEVNGDGDLFYTTNAAAPTTLHTLSVEREGTGSGTVASDPAGIYCGTDCDEQLLIGAGPIALTATAEEGSTFMGWGGACTGVDNCSVTLDAIKEISATFIQDPNLYTLSVNTNGGGIITSNPDGIDCGIDCTEDFSYGTPVNLIISANSNWYISDLIFESSLPDDPQSECEKLWILNSLSENDTETTSFSCQTTMDRSRSVTATFSQYALLAVTKIGTGNVISTPEGIDCGPDCEEGYTDGGTVRLTAIPANGGSFLGWSGACSGTETCDVIMDTAKSVAATFTQLETPYTLEVNASGNGMVSSTPAGIDCGADCSESFADGTSVNLSVTAALGWYISDMVFEASVPSATLSNCEKLWILNSLGGNPTDTSNFSCTTTMDRDRSITATFSQKDPIIPFAAEYIYVTNEGDNTVSVIDSALNTVINTISVGNRPKGIAVNPAYFRVYVTNLNDDTVSVIDTTTNTVTTTIAVGIAPHAIALNHSGNLAYVANYEDGTVSVIDTATNTVRATISIGRAPWGIIVNPAGNYVYATNKDDDTVSVIDAISNTVMDTVPVGNGPLGIAVNHAGTEVYVANELDNTISVIDTATNSVTQTIPGVGRTGIAVNPASNEVWVVNGGDVILINSCIVIHTITVGSGSDCIAFNHTGSRAYVTNNDNTVSVIDTATRVVIDTVEVGETPFGVAVTPISCTGDFNGDGDVDGSDLATLATGNVNTSLVDFLVHFGQSDCP